MKSSKAICVLGMHRSGTSALAGTLASLGVPAGNDLIPADTVSNPAGHWEHRIIIALHEELLEALGRTWADSQPMSDCWWDLEAVRPIRQRIAMALQQSFSGHSLWMIKDPRLCLLWPLWQQLAQLVGFSPHCVLLLRHPLEVAKSLHQRDGIPEEIGCAMWLSHILAAELHTRTCTRVFVRYDHLLSDWKQELSRIRDSFGLPLDLESPATGNAISAFLTPAHRHHTVTDLPTHAYQLLSLADEVYSTMCNNGHPDRIDELANTFECYRQQVHPWIDELARAHVAQAIAERKAYDLASQMTHMQTTLSWRMTKAFRIFDLGRRSICRPR